MPVNWLWKNKMGEMIFNNKGKAWKYNIYSANCLGCYLYEYNNENNEDEYRFIGFWNDTHHLKRMLGLEKCSYGCYEDCYKENGMKKIKLNTYFKDSITIAKWFSRAGHKVELYYKEIN